MNLKDHKRFIFFKSTGIERQMDFTSDSTVKNSSAGVSEPSSESNELSELDLRALRLGEQRNALLSKRNALLQEVNALKSRSRSSAAHEDVDARLLDLVLLAPSPTTESPAITIDGNSDLQKELAAKYDTLPLLNMPLRLACLRKLYQHVDLHVSTVDDAVEVHARFQRAEPFQVALRLRYDGEILEECHLDLSPSVQWELRSLLDCKNPSRILLGCFEFDRISYRRSVLLAELRQEMVRFASLVSITPTANSLTLQRFVTPQATFTVRFTIELDGFWPSSNVSTSLVNGQNVAIDIRSIAQGLFEEYGLHLGLLQLCKACLCL